MSETRSIVKSQAAELQATVSSLTSCLRRATTGEIDKLLAVLFCSLPSQDKGEFGDDVRLQAYNIALEGVSRHVLEAVVHETIRGRIVEFDPRFVPTPPQLARVCRERRADLERERMRADERLTDIRMNRSDPLSRFDYAPTAEEITRIDAKVAAFKVHAPADNCVRSEKDGAVADALAKIAASARSRAQEG